MSLKLTPSVSFIISDIAKAGRRKEKKKTMERYSSGHKNDPGGGKYYGYDACDQYDTLRAGK